MGIGPLNKQNLGMEQQRRPFTGRVLQLGRQEINTPGCAPQTDEEYFRWLGFDVVESLDVSAAEGPTYVADLNDNWRTTVNIEAAMFPSMAPREPSPGAIDVVYDGGTLEHIFHLPNALANIAALLKVAGRVIHASPCNNYVDHGFYQFSPCFFLDYYEANGWEINTCRVTLSDPSETDVRTYDYAPGCSDAGRGLPALDQPQLLWDVFTICTKLETSTCGVIPMQSGCRRLWGRMKADKARLEAERRKKGLLPPSP